MNTEKWITKNTSSLSGKVVAITGSTGGLGSKLCRNLVKLGASILMLDRNPSKSLALKNKIWAEFPNAVLENIKLDLGDVQNVKDVCAQLQDRKIDYLILNAGVYNVPLSKAATGYNNIFQVNFVSPYYLAKELLPNLKRTHGKIVVVSSIAHKYAKTDEKDIDFSNRKKAGKIYGNSKRFLTYSLYELLKDETDVTLAVAHPGVTLTAMTSHYPKAINWFVKFGVKVVFPSPQKAVLNLLLAMFADCRYHEWIGPGCFNIWGKPTIQKLRSAKPTECQRIFKIAEEICSAMETTSFEK